MAFQTTIPVFQPYAYPGDVIFDGPSRVDSALIDSSQGLGGDNVVGYAYSYIAGTDRTVTVGNATAGTNIFAGILINRLQYVNQGLSGDALETSLIVPDGTIGSLMIMGQCAVYLTIASGTIDRGDTIIYTHATGALSVGSAVANVSSVVPATVVWQTEATTTGTLAGIKLTN